eukprot:Phypoly_transcript_02876.p1 GENE.Phypoly_transcript_02876~~Phypoly_transcript_02876.p1  ORF type:complete len:830 (-),score=95.09 Phypoly_transcript_02876:113-2602(-)
MEKTAFQEVGKIEPLYTGGKLVVSFKGDFFVCACTDELYVVEFLTGKVVKRFEGDTSVITTLALHPDNTHVITCTRNLLIRNWDIETGQCKRVWKGHTGPIVDCDYHPGGTLVATASTDQTVKVWSPSGGFCTHNFVGHKGVVNIVRFFPSTRSRLLFSASAQCEIRVWNMDNTGENVLLINHMSLVTSFGFSIENNILYSAGSDKVLNVWDLTTKKLRATLITYEEEHSMAVLSRDAQLPEEATAEITKLKTKAGNEKKTFDLIALGGTSGILRVWCVDPLTGTGECVWRDQSPRATLEGRSAKYTEQIEGLSWCATEGTLACTTSTQNICFYDFKSGTKQVGKKKQFAGFLDSVLDLKFLDKECTKVVAATNSHDLVIFGLNTRDTTLLTGHTDVVLTIDVSRDGKWIVSGCRDHTVRLWDTATMTCVASGKGHTDPVTSIIFTKKARNNFVSVSQDRTIKMWNILGKDNKLELFAAATTRGHDKDVNSVDISPNDRLLATASQDRSIKLWNTANLSPAGELKGHRRGVWHVRFSTVDQCVASASADNTIRIWSLTSLACIKTLEGHAVSVMRCEYLTNGTQILSTGGDGVMKLWTIKTGQCMMTEEAHGDKAWALCVGYEASGEAAQESAPLRVVTGGADSCIKIWEDCSQAVDESRKKEEEAKVVVEQNLSNSLANKDFHRALVYALKLGHKGRTLEVLDTILVLRAEDADGGFAIGQKQLADVIRKLTDEQLVKCLLFIRDWNTIGKFSVIAQQFLHAILLVHPLSKLVEMTPKLMDLPAVLQGLIPYTEKHFNRIDNLIQSSYILNYTIKSISNNPDIMDIKD